MNITNATLIDGVHYDNKIVNGNNGVAKVTNVVTVKSKVPLITITARPSCSCGKSYSYKWRTRTFINYCPHCNRYNALVNKHKYPARHEQELTCKYDDCKSLRHKMNDELRKELETALTNTEKCREQIKSQLEKVREDDDADERQVHLLVNYNLELLDVKLRLKDFIEHLHLIQFD